MLFASPCLFRHAPAPPRHPAPPPQCLQEDALRPFVAVLRQCDEPAVRELAVQCVMQAVAAHPRGLGSGWRMATQALRLGAADGAPAVMAQAQEALQVGGSNQGRVCAWGAAKAAGGSLALGCGGGCVQVPERTAALECLCGP